MRTGDMIAALVVSYEGHSDAEILSAVVALPPLADESSPHWLDESYWARVVHPYLALADIAAIRKLRPAVPLLLERACFGDPGEIMRGLRHCFEGIYAPDWSALAEVCIAASSSPRLGTQLWALEQLAILEDPGARTVFERASCHSEPWLRDAAGAWIRPAAELVAGPKRALAAGRRA